MTLVQGAPGAGVSLSVVWIYIISAVDHYYTYLLAGKLSTAAGASNYEPAVVLAL